MNDNMQQETVLKTLRMLVPQRRLTYSESLRIAELQANRLIELFGLSGPAIPSELVTELPRIHVRLDPAMPVSGSAHWERGRWIISLNAAEPYARRRFSLMHEFKHVLDHTTKHYLYGDVARDEVDAEHSERAADHFAACLLMPKRWLKREWFAHHQNATLMARRYAVSPRALNVRLWHLGLNTAPQRCPRTSTPYRRSMRTTYFRTTPLLELVA
jgi:Zn-dependent peptidase ImmA (M78 family)